MHPEGIHLLFIAVGSDYLYCCEWVTSLLHNQPVTSPAYTGTQSIYLGGVDQMRVKCLAQVYNTSNMIFLAMCSFRSGDLQRLKWALCHGTYVTSQRNLDVYLFPCTWKKKLLPKFRTPENMIFGRKDFRVIQTRKWTMLLVRPLICKIQNFVDLFRVWFHDFINLIPFIIGTKHVSHFKIYYII